MRKSRFTLAKLCVLAGLLTGSIRTLSAQQYYGALTGTVTDSSGAVVPNVSIKVTNLKKGTESAAVTNEAGIYRVPGLTPDTYKLEAAAPNFKKFAREPLLVESN